ncbi:DUF3375 domain-containing protein [Sulfurovum sp. bin170]|uniref:DUF3375 domain-containing protein n=1 Tax=Sulfurovum sp. bin170 TaxID=2695268 RepID=UPI0013DF1AB7|nr:DUF3375 domain-containing protein [Sulfurovum sp. bin170]NEW60433.1 DUF3375 domain-containing protein [Sulfurovum sp. bin170]
MTYEQLKYQKTNHKALQLLNADNFAMIVAFFHHSFRSTQTQTLKESEILTKLDDFLYNLNQGYDEPKYPKTAKSYLDDFTNQKSSYLRKYYGYESDEPLYELTPDIERLITWLDGLQKQEFVATESKLNIIMILLKELEFETNLSDEERFRELEREKREIDAKIEAIKRRESIRFDDRKIKEHFMQIQKNSSELLSDFREIEHNFRTLNQEAKKAITNANSSKDEVLGEIFEIEESIRGSNQGQSFYAFWDFLMDMRQMEHLDELLDNLYRISQIEEMDSERKLENLKYHLLSGGENSHRVLGKLIEQLRRFIDDKLWVENRRILELAHSIEQKAIKLKDNPPTQREFFSINGVKITVESIASKRLFTPSSKEEFSHEIKEEIVEIDLSKLYAQVYVDEMVLKQNIQKLLQQKSQFSLKELNSLYPIKKGLSEVVVYLKLAQNMTNSYIDEYRDEMVIEDERGAKKRVLMDRVLFVRNGEKNGDK